MLFMQLIIYYILEYIADVSKSKSLRGLQWANGPITQYR